MAGDSEKSSGVVKTILVAIVIALATGGTAPFWWQYLFPHTQNTISNDGGKQGSGDAPKVTGLGVCGAGLPASNQFHDVAGPDNDWDWNCDGEVTREYGSCESLTREQCDPNTNATGKPPGFCSGLRGPLGCSPSVGECGKSGYVYPCFYTPSDGRCHAGGYETATVMRCK